MIAVSRDDTWRHGMGGDMGGDMCGVGGGGLASDGMGGMRGIGGGGMGGGAAPVGGPSDLDDEIPF